MTILLVEDHQDTRETLQRLLQKRGHTVLGASDIKSALVLGRETPCDLLMCDLQLPDGDGYQLLQALTREHEIIALAMSGHCASSDLVRTKAAGFFTHLIKPYDIEDVQSALALVQRELDLRRATGQTANQRDSQS
jgi:CheY-like chemotaxis protein